MPFLPFQFFSVNYGLNRLATLGVMFFPNDPKSRKQFIQTCLVDANLKVDSNARNIILKDLDLVNELLHTPSIDTIQDNVKIIYPRAFQAGMIVMYLYMLRQLGKSPSMNRAIRLLENRYSPELAKQNKTRVMPHSEESIRKNWRTYKSVSHLWAAHIAFNEKEPVVSLLDFDLFLARSEFLLSFCLEIVSERVKEPLFNKDEMWRVPEDYLLPVIEPIEMEIDDQLRSEIEGYSVTGITS